MRFVILDYKQMAINGTTSVPFGVVLQADKQVLFKFDTSSEKLEEIHKLNKNADPETFNNFGKTFQETYLSQGVVITSDETGQPVKIAITDPRFLDYLHNTFQNAYQYSKAREIQGDNPEKVVHSLFESQILKQAAE